MQHKKMELEEGEGLPSLFCTLITIREHKMMEQEKVGIKLNNPRSRLI